jgi:hypothetical protein
VKPKEKYQRIAIQKGLKWLLNGIETESKAAE